MVDEFFFFASAPVVFPASANRLNTQMVAWARSPCKSMPSATTEDVVDDVSATAILDKDSKKETIFSALLGAVIFFALAWAVYDSSRISIMLNLSTNLLELPKAWFQYLLCFFAVTTGLAMLLRSVEISVMNVDVRHQGEDVDHV